MGIETVVEKCNEVLGNKRNSINSLLYVFGKLVDNIPYSRRNTESVKSGDTDYLRECQFAIVYKYIDDEKKSDRMNFKNDSNANAKATDFINGLEKYLRNVCTQILSHPEGDDPYVTSLFDELEVIRSKSGHSLAQSLSTKINRYDSKALITAMHDALQKGITLKRIGEILAQNYGSVLAGHAKSYSSGPLPKYKEYLDRQKALNNEGK